MSKIFLFASLSIVVAAGAALVGCSKEEPSTQPAAAQPSAPSNQPAAAHDEAHAGHDHQGSAQSGHEHDAAGHAEHAGHSQYEDALAKLSPADRALAEKQKTCPVSGEPLGSMGTPYNVTVQGRDVLLCCSGCEAEIKKNPEKYLAKLPD